MARAKNLKASPRRKKMVDSFNEEFPTRTKRSAKRKSSFEKDFKEMIREIVASPAFRYAAGGVAAALLTRLANNMSDRYPEISNFIRDNLDTMESKLDSFKSSLDEERTRH